MKMLSFDAADDVARPTSGIVCSGIVGVADSDSGFDITVRC